jgi:putative PIN family toxin of toxin-antitoxin system
MKSEHTEKLKVVIDTNTVISAPLSEDGNPAKIFELLLLEEINNFRSEKITNEIVDVFNREKIKKLISEDKINFIIDNYRNFQN